MKTLRTILIVLFVLALAAGGGILFVFYKIHRGEGADIENWIGRQIIAVIEAHVNPRVGFKTLHYQAPYTVVITDLTLTAENQQFLSIRRILLELAEIPKLDKPIRIARVEMDDPKLQFLRDPQRGFIGWSNFVQQKVRSDLNAPPPGQRLSDVLVLEHVAVRNGELVYQQLGDGSDAMVLPGVNLALDIPRPAKEPGWHELKATLKREPLFTVDLDGRLNIDAMRADLKFLHMTADLGEEQYPTLPPQIQKLLREHDVKGHLVTDLNGQLLLSDPGQSELKTKVELTSASIASGKAILPVQRFALQATMANANVNATYDANLLRGTLQGAMTTSLKQPQPLQLTWAINGIRLEDTLRAIQKGEPEYAGRVVSTGQFNAMLANFPASISGGGNLNIDQGRLVNLPVLKQLLLLVAKIKFGIQLTSNDLAEVQFEFRPDHVYLSKLNVVSALLAVRGKGQVFYDQRLNLDVQAGVLEKLQGSLGRIGDLLGAIGGKMVSYKVTGVVGDPKVTINPLGLGK